MPLHLSAEPRSADRLDVAELVARGQDGDRWARGVLYSRFAPSLSRLIYRILGTRDEALDLVHDTFVYAFEHLDELRDATRFRAWLCRIGVSRTRSALRRQRLRHAFGLATDGIDLEDLRCHATHASQDAHVTLSELAHVLRRLSANERIAWVLRKVEAHTMLDVAAHGGWSLSTAKRLVASASSQIERYLGSNCGA